MHESPNSRYYLSMEAKSFTFDLDRQLTPAKSSPETGFPTLLSLTLPYVEIQNTVQFVMKPKESQR